VSTFRLFLLLILLTNYAHAQIVNGVIYEDNTTAKRILINNTTQNIRTYSDNEGFFKIKANVKDTLVFGSLFHKIKKIILEQTHFDEPLVIELKKVINELNEVHLTNEPVVKEFEAKAYTARVNNQIKEDIKRRPYLYAPPSSGNFDFIAIAALIGKLFKSNKPKQEAVLPISYTDLKSLFEGDSYFNEYLLFNQLKIPSQYKYLFFEYCETHQLSKDLLKIDTEFLLLNALMTCSKEFLEILENNKKD
jgi:hypothetical protein